MEFEQMWSDATQLVKEFDEETKTGSMGGKDSG
jgi:hypothetical protein